MKVQIPRGVQDILPEQAGLWRAIESKAADICERYGYEEIRTPIFEYAEVFSRSVGDTTDIVQKEMYTFQDKGGRLLSLRPEGTAPVVRAYVENKLFGHPVQPAKFYYIGPMFRYERPQAGRYRQFVQFGVEALGSDDPAIDAEVISLAYRFYVEMGLKNLQLSINSLGDKESRKAYKEALIAHFKPRIGEFCEDCQNRLEKNPLRILDCKVDRDHPLMKESPVILDYLNGESKEFFDKVLRYLDQLQIPYTIDPHLVRGLDYYHHTTFEIMSTKEGFGAITSLCGGGRYNGLVEEFGGPSVPGIGFALSIERLIASLEAEGIRIPTEKQTDVFIVTQGEAAKDYSVLLLQQLRSLGLKADRDYMDRKMKAQLKAADRLNSKYAAIIGDSEMERQVVLLRKMDTGEQREIPMSRFAEEFQRMVGGGA
ncbi:histidine--tRNA ligase [Caldibacillus debilis]|uniref:histidine--tRNA ligase n=1 Tax=Caldibacillus debilis TaxID=301148 RepID=UPI002FDAF7A0